MPAVAHTLEFDRVASLPRRRLTQAIAEAAVGPMTERFLCPGASARLLPWQAYSIAEAVVNGGAFLGLPVGFGKTLLGALVFAACDARRGLLVTSLGDKTYADYSSYRGVWRTDHVPIRITSREILQRENHARLLEEYQPDVIVIDEADDFANPTASATVRLDRYRRNNPDAIYVAMTGTPARKSLMNYWHILCWCLPTAAPVPFTEAEARMWAAALDVNVGTGRVAPGPLGPTLKAARAWYSQRLVETPGVIIVDGDSCSAPLTFRMRLAREDRVLDAAYERFLKEDESPGGVPVGDPLSRWLLDGMLGLGVYPIWDPPPPEEWRIARRAVARFVRERCASSQRGHKPLETELQVLRHYHDHPTVREWLRVKPMFDDARRKYIWITDSAIHSVQDWLAELDTPGVVWTGSVEFGERLAHATGLDYYGPQGRTATGMQLHAAPPDRSLIASWKANKKGYNLQAWRRQLITMPPQSAKWLEQIAGRAHRQGQDEHVIVDILVTSGGTLDLFAALLEEARGVKETTTLTQKVLRSKVIRARPRMTASNMYRWARGGGGKDD